ncbi:MAG: hypothetical protein AB1797_08045 [bacterium]
MPTNNIPPVLNELKANIFYEILELVGRVFIVVRYSDNVNLGKRGFLPEEKENGLVLVFNSQMKFVWGEAGIEAALVFGNSLQRCFIPEDDIVAVYSPELKVQFIVGYQGAEEEKGGDILKTQSVKEERKMEKPKVEYKDNVVKVDFSRKARKE